jgi:hypothetical protein
VNGRELRLRRLNFQKDDVVWSLPQSVPPVALIYPLIANGEIKLLVVEM